MMTTTTRQTVMFHQTIPNTNRPIRRFGRIFAEQIRFLALAAAFAFPLLNPNAASLHDASKNGNLDEVNRLIAAGADVNTKDDDGTTPLHWAYRSTVSIIEALVAAGADVNAKENKGRTSLHWASGAPGGESIVEALLIAGSDVNAKDTIYGQTPLYWARSADIVSRLITAGADVNAKDNDGKTPLHLPRNVDAIKALLAAGADVDAKDNDGLTTLHHVTSAPSSSSEEIIANIMKALLAAGADVHAKDNEGRTPLDINTN